MQILAYSVISLAILLAAIAFVMVIIGYFTR